MDQILVFDLNYRAYVLDIVENHYYPILNHLSSSVDGTIRVRPNEDLPS